MSGNNEDNTTLNLAHTNGSVYRDIYKSGVKTQVVALDAGGSGTESLVSTTVPLPVEDPWLNHAIHIIKATYGDDVSVYTKNKDLLKFGRNQAVGTTIATLMTLPAGVDNETYVSDNLITTISSSSNSDTVEVIVEGHTISGTDLTFVSQAITLTGQTQATLTTPMARCTRIYNNNSTDLVGTIYVYEDDTSTAGVPDTAAKVHAMIRAGENQTEKASTSVSSIDYWIITEITADVLEKTAAFAEVQLEIRLVGKVFRPVVDISASSTSQGRYQFKPYVIAPKNCDVRLRAIASGASIDVSGTINGVLATVV